MEAIDRTGLVVTGEGAFVRVLRVTPANPLILSGSDRDAIAAGFGRMLGRLRPGQSMQFYLDARPIRLDAVLAELRADVRGRGRAGADAHAARARRDGALALAAVRGAGAVAAPARRGAGRGRARAPTW